MATANTSASQSSTFDSIWPVIVAGIAQKYLGGSGSGDTPNYYFPPLTDAEKWREDYIKKTIEEGGTPTQKSARSAIAQMFTGAPVSAPGFEFMSPELQGKAFGGGVAPFPKLDFTKMLGDITSNPPTPDKGDVRDRPRPPLGDTRPDLGNAANNPDYLRSIMDGLPIDEAQWPSIMQAWNGYKSANPDWIKKGVSAAASVFQQFGLPGMIIGTLLKRLLTSEASAQPQNPFPTKTPGVTVSNKWENPNDVREPIAKDPWGDWADRRASDIAAGNTSGLTKFRMPRYPGGGVMSGDQTGYVDKFYALR